MKLFILALTVLFLAVITFVGCDIFEDEEGDWPNDVTIRIFNQTDCLVDIFVDGEEQESIQFDEYIEVLDLGRGVHLLEAYPWNDEQHSCDSVYTNELASGDDFEWEILASSPCSTCDPTPTPAPTTTPEPEATATT